MTQSVRFLPLAQLEVIEAKDWYTRRSADLGEAFLNEVDRIVRLIGDNPLGYPLIHADIRRARLRRFPYSLFFRVAATECFVLACFHAKRDPHRWQERA